MMDEEEIVEKEHAQTRCGKAKRGLFRLLEEQLCDRQDQRKDLLLMREKNGVENRDRNPSSP
jgi:hypothetical protein